jgi:integrase
LRPWLARKRRGQTVFPHLPLLAARTFRADLKRAGIPYRDGQGLFADFHSLRHTYISRLVRSGVSVKTAQVMARHSTPTLTIGRYAHADLGDKRAALAALPAVTVRASGAA